jgi:predicted nucleotidyltransferase
MDTKPKNKLTLEEDKLINGLSSYLDIPFYYYGSIQRDDYIKGKSDIDVAIFTDNEQSVIFKMQHYLKVDKEKFKKVLWKLKQNNTITYGYKLKYEKDKMNIEFAVYNEKSKKDIIEFQDNTILIPFYIKWILSLLKVLHYQLNILPSNYYMFLKRKVFSLGTNQGHEELFIVLKQYQK